MLTSGAVLGKNIWGLAPATLPLPPLRSRPHQIQLGAWGSAASSTSLWGLGRRTGQNRILCILAWTSGDIKLTNFSGNRLTTVCQMYGYNLGDPATIWWPTEFGAGPRFGGPVPRPLQHGTATGSHLTVVSHCTLANDGP